MVVIYTVRILQDRDEHNEAFTLLSNIFPNKEIMIHTNLSLCNTLTLQLISVTPSHTIYHPLVSRWLTGHPPALLKLTMV